MNEKEQVLRTFAARVEEFAPGIPWEPKKFPFANPFLDLEIEPPAAAVLVLDGIQWRFEGKVPNAANVSEPVGSLGDEPKAVVKAVMSQIVFITQTATERGDDQTAFLFASLLCQMARAMGWKQWRLIAVVHMRPLLRASGMEQYLLPGFMSGITRADLPENLHRMFDSIRRDIDEWTPTA